MGQINNNSASHGGPGKPSGGTDFARPFAQANVPVPPYSIECHYKASAWNPGLDWQQAVGRKLAEGPDGAAFGWWTPEAGGAVPDDNAGNDRFNQCVIVVTYQDMQLLTQEELPVVLGQISGRGAVR
jgi:hypothetical protein